MKKKNPIKKRSLVITVALPDNYINMLETIMARNYTENKSATLKILIKKEYEKIMGTAHA